MLAAVKGIIKGNTVVIEDEDLQEYDGTEVIVTILDMKKKEKKKIDLSNYMGKGKKMFNADAQEYVKELREDDRV